MSAKPIALILGAGSNIGTSAANTFLTAGYRVAKVSRSAKTPENGGDDQLGISCDFSKPETVPGVFKTLRKIWGEPSVVIYNAAAASFGDAKDPLANLSLETLVQHQAINTLSPTVALQSALSSFSALPAGSPRPTFIYTGNALNTPNLAMPSLITLGMGKAATGHMLEAAAKGYGEKGYGIYYADERTPEGAPTGMKVGGEAHGEFFLQLVEGKAGMEEGGWWATFVKGKGYQKF